jgi:hypothetical protein
MKLDPRAIVAIMLTLVLLIIFSAGSYNIATKPEAISDPVFSLVENILFTIVGALAGYIAGRDNAGS